MGCHRHLTEHEPNVCGKCIGKVRVNLRRIRELCTLTLAAAIENGYDSTAATVAGPVPEYATYQARHRWATVYGGLCRCGQRGAKCPDDETIEGPPCGDEKCKHTTCARLRGMRVCPDFLAWVDNADDERHPLWVLGSWDMLVAEHLGHKRTLRVTVPTAAAYLDSNLTDLARYEDFAFDELAREVRSCLVHVEDALALTPHVTKGAPCPVCYREGRPAKPLERTYAPGRTDDSHDEWACPRDECGQTWTAEEYDKYVAREHRNRATVLPESDIVERFRIKPTRLRQWATRGHVTRRGRTEDGRTLYDVADVERMREAEGDTNGNGNAA